MFQYEATVIRIVDGDTLWLNVDLGFKIHYEIDVRLADVNTPEVVKYGVSGISDPAKAYVQQCVPPGSVCVVDISRPEKYGRWLARIYYQPGVSDRSKILANPRVLNDELVQRGFAQRYEGGKR